MQRRFAWSVTSLLVLLILLSGLLVALPLARRHAQNLFMAQAEAVQARLEAAFGPVEPVLQLLVTAWASDAPSLQTSLPFVQAARGALQALPLATSAVVGNARGEGWMLLQHPQRPEWWLRLTDRARWGEEQRFMAWDAHGVELRRWSERLPYDPRERPWYRLGQGHPARMVWTPPYVFYTTGDLGITVARGWRDGAGQDWVAGLDLRLDEIGAVLRELPGPMRLRLALTDAQGRVLALHRRDAGLPLASAALQPLAETTDEVLQQLPPRRGGIPEAGMQTVWHAGQPWLGLHRPVTLGDQVLYVWMSAPVGAFMPPWSAWLGMFLIGVGATLLLGMWVVRRGARRLAEPIEYLADAAQRMAHLSFEKSVRTDWASAELHTLARALNHLRRRLAVYTGRLRQREQELAHEVAALKAAEKRLLHLGLYDTLTDLPNRRLLLEQTQHALARVARSGTQLALVFLDLDHFKEINDSRGHEVGDELLQEVARRLRATVRGGDLVARLGGDEFVLLLEDVQEQGLAARAEELMRVLQQPIEAGGQRWSMGASLGIALGPRDGADASTLLRHADEAMYRAKNAGRGRWVMYEPAFSRANEDVRILREDMRAAIDAGAFELWWQPQVELASGRAVAAEALLRWQHPARGWVPPVEFIALAEKAGLMPALGERVFDLVLQAAPLLAQSQPQWRHLAVNVSALQLESTQFADMLLSKLEQSGWPAQRLEIEVTESVLLESEVARAQLRRLADKGVRIALDDFGTGYSSLSYLRQLPLTVVKIDASFVRDIGYSPRADGLVEALIGLARALELDLVAEGVQTQLQRQFLVEHGVRCGQGYLWSPPRPLAHWNATVSA